MSKRTRKPQHRHTFRIALPGGLEIQYLVPVKNATHVVELTRTEADVLQGKPGIACACADAASALRNKNKFPHPVHAAEFIRTYAFLVDKVSAKGVPKSCVKYRHDDDSIPEFDVPGGKKKLLDQGKAKRVITLRPPRRSDTRVGRGVAGGVVGGKSKGRVDGSRSKPIGSLKRKIDAGFLELEG